MTIKSQYIKWAAAMMLLCLLLGIVAVMGLTSGADRAVLKALALRQGVDESTIISLFQGISWSGEAAQRSLLAVVAALWLFWKKRPRAALVMIVAPALTGVTSSLLKQLYARPRPDIVPHLDAISNLSYPSGHASNAMAICVLIALLIPTRRRALWMAVALIVAIAIGVSRMMLGVHYPSDVIGGWLWGAGVALIGAALLRKWESR